MSTTPPPPPPPSGMPPSVPPPPGGGPPPPSGAGGYGAGGWSPGPTGPKPQNYLVVAILTTLFCCLPFGVVSIVYAAQVDSKYNSGDYAGSVASSESAKKWAIISAVAALALTVGWLLFVVALAG